MKRSPGSATLKYRRPPPAPRGITQNEDTQAGGLLHVLFLELWKLKYTF